MKRLAAELGAARAAALDARMARYHNSAMQHDLVSKTQRKHQMHELQVLGAALVALAPVQLDAIALPEELAEAVRAARRIRSRAARRRQLQYIGRLMRAVDAEPIRAALAAIVGRSSAARARQRRVELWRERLMGDDKALTEYARSHPGVDLQTVRSLIRSARREIAEGLPPRALRGLFRVLREAEEAA
jgi:ribosome-associated protein